LTQSATRVLTTGDNRLRCRIQLVEQIQVMHSCCRKFSCLIRRLRI
jgi:hypothetical protein